MIFFFFFGSGRGGGALVPASGSYKDAFGVVFFIQPSSIIKGFFYMYSKKRVYVFKQSHDM